MCFPPLCQISLKLFGGFEDIYYFCAKIYSMGKDLRAKLTYIINCIAVFAEHFDLQPKQAYSYLKRFGGLAFIDECYAAEHTLSLDDAVEDMAVVCQRNGGGLI